MTIRTISVLTIAAAVACTARVADRQASERTPDSAIRASLPPPSAAVALSPDSALIGGACPFECCHYGKWTLDSNAALRMTPSVTASITAHIEKGTEVLADTGFVVVNPVGLIVGTSDFRQEETGLELHRGDTLFVLDEMGEGKWHARLHGEPVTVSAWEIDTAGNYGAKLVRAPRSVWWVHFTAPGSRGGWGLMDEIQEHGADACGV